MSKLKWRCRRGLLENDLFIARFFERHESRLTVGQAQAMEALMDLSDHDLLDLLLKRKEPEPDLAGPGVVDLLRLMRV
ncbi:succinate dehydrogenase assembly factor 2 [Variovorax robiniae]|uniref:FAD assembly factor SdhE n=1 Tax=Variovorax robiniae TaxID=1836199 RepID=A0ABU8X369_9BURK